MTSINIVTEISRTWVFTKWYSFNIKGSGIIYHECLRPVNWDNLYTVDVLSIRKFDQKK